MTLTALSVLTLAGAAMISDLKTGKISNVIVIAGLAVGLILRIFEGIPLVLSSGGAELALRIIRQIGIFLAGAAIPFLPGFLLFRFRMIGAGDIKLLMAIGGMIGVQEMIRYMAVTVVFGAVISLMIMLSVTGIRPRIERFIRYVRVTEMTGEILPYRDSVESEFHFTVPVMMAAAVYAAGLIRSAGGMVL